MGDPEGSPLARLAARARRRWRAWLRSLHRDAGYLAIGLTVLYAVSGIAINHIGSWDPNFKTVRSVRAVTGPFSEDPEVAGAAVLGELGIELPPRDVFYDSETSLEIHFDNQMVVVDTAAASATISAERPRWFLRVANWLHYNRGKAAWTYIADGYAVFLLFLAGSGALMLKGRKGFVGRGAVLIAIGAAIPLLYVHFSGGP